MERIAGEVPAIALRRSDHLHGRGNLKQDSRMADQYARQELFGLDHVQSLAPVGSSFIQSAALQALLAV